MAGVRSSNWGPQKRVPGWSAVAPFNEVPVSQASALGRRLPVARLIAEANIALLRKVFIAGTVLPRRAAQGRPKKSGCSQ